MIGKRARRWLSVVLISTGSLIVVGAAPVEAQTPRVKGCMGADTSAGARQGTNGALRSWLARDGEVVFGAGVRFGDIVQYHQAGYLGGSCGS